MNEMASIVMRGLIVCRLTGIVLGSKLEHGLEPSDLFGVAPPSDWDAIDYEQEVHDEEEVELDNVNTGSDSMILMLSSGLTPRAAAMSLLEGPAGGGAAIAKKWTPSLNTRDLEDLRNRRRKIIRAELEPFVANPANTARGVLEAALKPVRDAIKIGTTKRWPGAVKMMCRLMESAAKPLHPSWNGWRLDRSHMPTEHEKRVWKLMGYDGVENKKPEKPKEDDTIESVVILFERLEQIGAVNGTRFETAIPGLMKMLDSGVLTEQGAAVNRRELEWYTTRRSATLYVQWTEAVRSAFVEGRFGPCI